MSRIIAQVLAVTLIAGFVAACAKPAPTPAPVVRKG